MNDSSGKSVKLVWAFLFIYVVLSLIYAFASSHTWDDDCPTRYYNTLNAFNDPIHFVSLWNRPLFTLIFAIPVQFGKFMIPVMMALISAAGAYYLYRALVIQGIKNAWLIVPLLLFQTYFFGISRNAETEPLAVAIFCLGYYFMVKEKWFWFALFAGLLPLARLELVVLFPFWGLILLKAKQFKLIFMMIVPLFLWNIAGGIITGDFAYLIEKTVGGDNESNRYGHTTFGHYFQRFIYGVGPLFFFFFLIGLAKGIFTKVKYKGFVVFQFIAGFLIYVIFSWKLNMGNAAGFMRNLTPLSALAAILALYGVNYWVQVITDRFFMSSSKSAPEPFEELSDEEFHELNRKKRQAYIASKNKYEREVEEFEQQKESIAKRNRRVGTLKYGLFGFLLVILVLLTWKYFTLIMLDHHKLLEDSHYHGNLYMIAGVAVLSVILLLIKRFVKIKTLILTSLIGVTLVLFTAISEPPVLELTEERSLMEEVSDLFLADEFQDKTLYVNHIWFFWANDLDKYDDRYQGVKMANLDSAEVGSICIWENHYSHRLSGDVQANYFDTHKEWVKTTYFMAQKAGFRAMIYEKVDTSNKMAGLEAIQRFNDVIPNHSDGWICLANYYTKELNKRDSAEKYFTKAIEIDSLNHNAYFNRGVARFGAREMRPAQEDFTAALYLKPKWADAWINLGATYSNVGSVDSAIIAYSRALQIDDKKPPAYLNRGKMYEVKKDTIRAINDYSYYLQSNRKDTKILWSRARLYAGQKKWDACMKDLNQIITINPKIREVWLLKGVCYLNDKKMEEAKKSFLQAQALGHPAATAYLSSYFPQ